MQIINICGKNMECPRCKCKWEHSQTTQNSPILFSFQNNKYVVKMQGIQNQFKKISHFEQNRVGPKHAKRHLKIIENNLIRAPELPTT